MACADPAISVRVGSLRALSAALTLQWARASYFIPIPFSVSAEDFVAGVGENGSVSPEILQWLEKQGTEEGKHDDSMVRESRWNGESIGAGEQRAALAEVWAESVLPLIGDVEGTVSKACSDAVVNILLTPAAEDLAAILKDISRGKPRRVGLNWSWEVLYQVAGREDLKRCLCEALVRVMEGGGFNATEFTVALLSYLEAMLEEEMEGVAPMTMADLSGRKSDPRIRRGCLLLLASICSPLPTSGNKLRPSPALIAVDAELVLRVWSSVQKEMEELEKRPSGAAASSDEQTVASTQERYLLGEAVDLLHTLKRVVDDIDKAEAVRLADTVLDRLVTYRWDAPVLGAAMELLTALCATRASNPQQSRDMIASWVERLFDGAEPRLQRYVISASREGGLSAVDHQIACRCLFTVGNLVLFKLTKSAQSGPSQTKALPSSHDADMQSEFELLAAQEGFEGACALANRLGVSVEVPAGLTTLVEALVAPQYAQEPSLNASSPFTGDVSQFSNRATALTPPEVRGFAFITLGKMCLVDKGLARRYMPVFVRELRRDATPVVVRNNLLFILGDLCIRYTAMVDRYVPEMARCAIDHHPLVRKHAILLLSQLLLEDYVKWRGVLFFRFIHALADPEPSVRVFTESILLNLLLRKQPHLFVSNFVPAMLALTGCRVGSLFQSQLMRLAGGQGAVEEEHKVEAASAADFSSLLADVTMTEEGDHE